MSKKIFLIGLPGSGKSTLGISLANELNLLFVDLDKEIEKTAGKTIPEIFTEVGEAGFRKAESEQLNQFCAQPSNFVMATGGGAPCFNNNLEAMKKVGTLVFLDVPPAIIAHRIKNQIAHRPLLKTESTDELLSRMEKLREQRITFYQQAHATVTGGSLTAHDILKSLH